MLIRKCSAKHPTKIFRSPYGVKEVEEIGKIPDKRFCVVSHGQLISEYDIYSDADNALVAECAKHHTQEQKQHGRFKIGKHKLINAVLSEA